MGRGRIILKCIQDEKARTITFNQRGRVLIKKISDFSTTFGVETCFISCGYDNARPVTWPKDPAALSILVKYVNQKNEEPLTFDLKDYFEKRKKMVEDEISKRQKEILKVKYPTLYPSFRNLEREQLMTFMTNVYAKIEACSYKINMLKNKLQSEASSSFMQNTTHMQNMAQESVSFPHLNQLNFMYTISNSQLNHAPMMPLKDNSMVVLAPMLSLNNNSGMINSSNQVDVTLDSTNQLYELLDWVGLPYDHADWVNQLMESDDWSNYLNNDFMEWINQPDESILQNIPFQPQNQNQNQPQEASLHALPAPRNGIKTDN